MGQKRFRNRTRTLKRDQRFLVRWGRFISDGRRAWIRFARSLGTWQKIGAASAIATLIASYLALAPRFSLDAPNALDAAHPFSTPFVLTNVSPAVSFQDITYKCWEKTLQVTRVQGVKGYTPNFLMFWRSSKVIRHIAPGERATIKCINMFGVDDAQYPITSAEVMIEVSGRAFWLPRQQRKTFRFVTQSATERQLTWFAEPIGGAPTVREEFDKNSPKDYEESVPAGGAILGATPVFKAVPPPS